MYRNQLIIQLIFISTRFIWYSHGVQTIYLLNKADLSTEFEFIRPQLIYPPSWELIRTQLIHLLSYTWSGYSWFICWVMSWSGHSWFICRVERWSGHSWFICWVLPDQDTAGLFAIWYLSTRNRGYIFLTKRIYLLDTADLSAG